MVSIIKESPQDRASTSSQEALANKKRAVRKEKKFRKNQVSDIMSTMSREYKTRYSFKWQSRILGTGPPLNNLWNVTKQNGKNWWSGKRKKQIGSRHFQLFTSYWWRERVFWSFFKFLIEISQNYSTFNLLWKFGIEMFTGRFF